MRRAGRSGSARIGPRDDREPGAAGRSGSARIGPRDDREPGAAGRSGSARIGPRDDREPGAAGRSGSGARTRCGPRAGKGRPWGKGRRATFSRRCQCGARTRCGPRAGKGRPWGKGRRATFSRRCQCGARRPISRRRLVQRVTCGAGPRRTRCRAPPGSRSADQPAQAGAARDLRCRTAANTMPRTARLQVGRAAVGSRALAHPTAAIAGILPPVATSTSPAGGLP